MKFYTLLLAVLVLLIAGCSDNQITEIDHPEDEETPEIVRSEEPPELVAAWNKLWMQIEQEKLDGEVDTTKVLQANRIAVELSKYDGPVQRAFKIIAFIHDARAAGKSEQEIKKEGKQFVQEIFDAHVPKSHCETEQECEECKNDCDEAYREADQELAIDFFEENSVECVTPGLGGIVRFPTPWGVAGSLTYIGGCVGYNTWRYKRKVDNNKSERDRCYDSCKPPKTQ